MEYRLANIFANLESQLIANQKAVFLSYPNSSLTNVLDFQVNMRANQSMLEKINIKVVNDAYSQATNYINDIITKGYNKGIKSISNQLDMNIKNDENKKAKVLKNNADSVISSMCRIALSSAMGAFSGIVSAVSLYNQTQDLYQAIDQAQSQYLEKGIVGSIKTNGAQTNIETFSDIVESEFEHSATLTGEGYARDETGNYYIVVSSHFGCCEKCAKWENLILIDDVFANGKSDGKHRLLSEAIEQGLMHPNCRHRFRVPLKGEEKELKGDYHETWTKEQNKQQYQAEQKQRRYEREIRKYKRFEQGSLTQSEQIKAHQKVLEYQAKQREHIKASNKIDGVKLFRQYERERIGSETKAQMPIEFENHKEQSDYYSYLKLPFAEKNAVDNYISSDSYKINSMLRDGIELDEYFANMKGNLIRALDELPKVKNQDLVRNISIDKEFLDKFYNEHVIGNEIKYNQFISTTTKDSYNDKSNVQILIQRANKASDLTKINIKEKEALYPPNIPFKVLDKRIIDGIIYILLEEK